MELVIIFCDSLLQLTAFTMCYVMSKYWLVHLSVCETKSHIKLRNPYDNRTFFRRLAISFLRMYMLLYLQISFNQLLSFVLYRLFWSFHIIIQDCHRGSSSNTVAFVSPCLSCHTAPALQLCPTASVFPPSSALIRLPPCTIPHECSSSRSGSGPRSPPFSKQRKFLHRWVMWLAR